MDWTLPPMSQPAFETHVNDCRLSAARQYAPPRYYKFSDKTHRPSLCPQRGDRLFVRLADASGRVRYLGHHQVLGTNRSFDRCGQRDGWQLLYAPEFISMEPEPAPDDACFHRIQSDQASLA